ncbi:hypothetical protein IE986_16465 [Klebsiella pneumoniae]|uniref:Uncharacterized protein n=1 Tax=Klebsiella pneumoniae TaxID=573 RepID=A0A927DAY4_KLEPN|nr:hypothetical protein [Klebsiella pneumoniae]
MRKPLTKEGGMLSFEQKQCLKKTEREKFSSLFYLNYFSFERSGLFVSPIVLK